MYYIRGAVQHIDLPRPFGSKGCSSTEFFIFRPYYLLCTIYKMSGRSLSVYTDTSASHEYLCTLIKNAVA